MFTNKKREGINRFVCDVSFYVTETPKASTKDHEPLLPIIPFGIVAYGRNSCRQFWLFPGLFEREQWRTVKSVKLTLKENSLLIKFEAHEFASEASNKHAFKI